MKTNRFILGGIGALVALLTWESVSPAAVVVRAGPGRVYAGSGRYSNSRVYRRPYRAYRPPVYRSSYYAPRYYRGYERPAYRGYYYPGPRYYYRY